MKKIRRKVIDADHVFWDILYIPRYHPHAHTLKINPNIVLQIPTTICYECTKEANKKKEQK